jgi:hypothetical protein
MSSLANLIQETLADYNEVTSIHVYSIGPHPTKVRCQLS